jgi:imidazolonepropionase-like amidohydrolase
MFQKISFILILFASTLPIAFANNVYVIHAGKVLVIPGEKPLSEQTLVIRDGLIEQVIDGYKDANLIDADSKLIDLKSQFVLPGLMDMHVHLLGEINKSARTEALYYTTSMQELRGAYFAKLTLMAGFTTVRDLGGNPEAIYALREMVNKRLNTTKKISLSKLVKGIQIHEANITLT